MKLTVSMPRRLPLCDRPAVCFRDPPTHDRSAGNRVAHDGAADKPGSRTKLLTAALKVNSQAIFARPRNLARPIGPTAFIQPKCSSIRLRMR